MREFTNRHERLQYFEVMNKIVKLMKEYHVCIKDLEEYRDTIYKHKGDKLLSVRRGQALKKTRRDNFRKATEKRLANQKRMKSKKKAVEEVKEEAS